MLEKDFQANIIQLAKTLGWMIHHDGGNMGGHTYGDPGFPDLVLAKAGRVVFLELKSDKGTVTVAQSKWMLSLPNAHIVRPADLEWIAQALGPNGDAW